MTLKRMDVWDTLKMIEALPPYEGAFVSGYVAMEPTANTPTNALWVVMQGKGDFAVAPVHIAEYRVNPDLQGRLITGVYWACAQPIDKVEPYLIIDPSEVSAEAVIIRLGDHIVGFRCNLECLPTTKTFGLFAD